MGMILKDRIRIVLREHYGEFDTYLEHEYEEKITNRLIEGNMALKKIWATYNQVVLEMKNSIKDDVKVKELQYKLTDDMDPRNVCIEVIEDVKEKTAELTRLYEKIKKFKELT